MSEDKEVLEAIAPELQKFMPDLRVEVCDRSKKYNDKNLMFPYSIIFCEMNPTRSLKDMGLKDDIVAQTVFKDGKLHVAIVGLRQIIAIDFVDPNLDLGAVGKKINDTYLELKEDGKLTGGASAAVLAASVTNPNIKRLLDKVQRSRDARNGT